ESALCIHRYFSAVCPDSLTVIKTLKPKVRHGNVLLIQNRKTHEDNELLLSSVPVWLILPDQRPLHYLAEATERDQYSLRKDSSCVYPHNNVPTHFLWGLPHSIRHYWNLV